jgi:hypothetical protein
MCVIQHLTKTIKGRKDLFWLIVSEISVHSGGEGIAEELTIYQSGSRERDCLCCIPGMGDEEDFDYDIL